MNRGAHLGRKSSLPYYRYPMLPRYDGPHPVPVVSWLEGCWNHLGNLLLAAVSETAFADWFQLGLSLILSPRLRAETSSEGFANSSVNVFSLMAYLHPVLEAD